ncbi:hypothetical protein ES705_33425 [subsurface metagenome]
MKGRPNIYKSIKPEGFGRSLNILYRIIIILLLLIGSIIPGNGQDFKYYTQYMFNGLAINPAYAGSHDFIAITGNIREQWVGIKGAPSTQTISAHSPILNDQFGLGLIVINDKVGVVSQQEVSVNYSYRLRFPGYNLALGLKLGFNSLKSRFDELILDDEADANFQNNKTAFLPVVGIGAFLKTNQYYVGLSVPHLYKFVHKSYEDLPIDQNMLIFLTGGYIYTINNDFKLKPSFLAKTHFGSVFEMDLNTNVYYKDDYCIGLSYKSFNSLAIILEIGFNKTYYIGYSYDLATTKLIKHQTGTHEISFNVYLNKKDKTKIINPRYF